MLITKLIFSLLILFVLVLYYWKHRIPSVYVKSNVDNKYYLVRDLKDKQEVADTLAYLMGNVRKLIDYMMVNAPDKYKQYIVTLNNKLPNVKISENVYDMHYTSYSINKGEKLVFCMRSRKASEKDKQHNINLMTYVVLHEISHIACPVWGHEQLFKEIFKYVTQSAIDIGIYKPIDFKIYPTEYCGMTITDSIV